uniref:Uncharacterized protein n=1 Tax=Oryza nivara TaxID=4536 RepID=A0A0E0HB97_ORYNI
MENLQALHFEDWYQRDGEHPEEQHESHLKFTRCSHDKANYMRITSPEDSPDTTGVHVVSSRNVHIMDDSISTCHDCVSIVGSSMDVRLKNREGKR